MMVYIFDGTMDGLLTAVFDAFALHEQPETLLTEGEALPLFCERTQTVHTDEEKARRVWTGLEKKLSREAMKLISVSWLSELKELNGHLFRYICKVFTAGKGIERHFADPDVLAVTNIARKVLHEQLTVQDNALVIYPNPVSDQLILQGEGLHHVSLVSITGATVFDSDIADNGMVIDMARVPQGLYLLTVCTDEGVKVEKVVKR